MIQISRKRVPAISIGCAFTIACVSAFAQNIVGYRTLDTPAQLRESTAQSGQLEVLEFFWFGCTHCFTFEPTINAWVDNKPDHVNFVREAPPLNSSWVPHSQAFYAAETMGVTEQLIEPLFNAIHIDKRRLSDFDSIADFAGSLGINAESFANTMQSQEVQESMEEAIMLAMDAEISGVPSVLINGKYLTSNSLAGGHDGIIRVINSLLESEKF